MKTRRRRRKKRKKTRRNYHQSGGFFGKTFAKTLKNVFGKTIKKVFTGMASQSFGSLTSKSLGPISNSTQSSEAEVEKWPICSPNERPLTPGGPDGCGKNESPQPTKEQLERGWAYGNHPGNISSV